MIDRFAAFHQTVQAEKRKDKPRRKPTVLMAKECAFCGETFKPRRYNNRFCSKPCNLADARAVYKAKREAILFFSCGHGTGHDNVRVERYAYAVKGQRRVGKRRICIICSRKRKRVYWHKQRKAAA